jgi:tetratricopeptide (TPR) repeat protein
LSSIVIAVLGVYFTDSYRKQDVRIAQAQTIEKFLPALNSTNAGDKRGALLAIYALQNDELAARLAASYITSENIDACETILGRAKGDAKEELIDAVLIAYSKRALEKFASWANNSPESMIFDFNRIFQLRNDDYIAKKWGKWDLANWYAERGNVYRDSRDYEKADADYQKALQIYPNHYWVFLNIGIMNSDQEKFEEAVQNINKSIELNKYSGESYSTLAETYVKMKQPDKAADYFDKAIAIDPNKYNLYFKRAYFNLNQKLDEKASSDFRIIYESSDGENDRSRALQELKTLDPKYYQAEKIKKENAGKT